MYFEYLDYPKVPENLLLSNFDNLDNIFHKPDYPYYKQYHINKELLIFLELIFPFPFFASYQIIFDGIAIHKDDDRIEAINYLIEPGGKFVETNFFDDEKLLLHSENIKEHQWHKIRVDINHNVSNIRNRRLALTIVPNDKIISTN